MMKTFVVIGLGAVIVFSPLAAMAQSALERSRRRGRLSQQTYAP